MMFRETWWLGLTPAAWAMVLLALWLVTAVLLGIVIGRMIRRSHQLEQVQEARQLAEHRLSVSTGPEARQTTTYRVPYGRHHEDTSQMTAVRADPAEAVQTRGIPAQPGAWTPDVHPSRRSEDRGALPSPPREGGRRRSDERMTRSAARRLRDGD